MIMMRIQLVEQPTTSGRSSLLPVDDYLRVYQLFRERVVQEDNLNNHRMTWLIYSEAIVLGLWGTVVSQDMLTKACNAGTFLRMYIVLCVLCSVGIILAGVSWIAIQAAKSEISYIRDEIYGKQYKFIADDNRIPRLVGSQGRHPLGHLMTWGCPLLFIVMWVYFAFFSVFNAHC